MFSTESDIDEFLSHYRSSFSNATTTPKLHIVEDHVVELIRCWRVEVGILGDREQKLTGMDMYKWGAMAKNAW